MNYLPLAGGAMQASAIIMGCMRINRRTDDEIRELIHTALDCGVNFFDHADRYGGGGCEKAFGRALDLRSSLREKIFIQTKCGLRNDERTGKRGFHDLSREHIVNSVDGSLQRLGTDYIDVFLLHRPDALMEPEEVAEAFDALYQSGKVRHFGVSNFKPMQIELIRKYAKQPITVNQLQFSIMNTGMIDFGMNVNMKTDSSIDRDGSVLEYCRLHDMTVQTWSPFQYGFFKGTFLGNEQFPELNAVLDELGEQYGVPSSAIAAAWILRHPARMQVVTGTTNPEHLRDICQASGVSLTRQEWYRIYLAAGNKLP